MSGLFDVDVLDGKVMKELFDRFDTEGSGSISTEAVKAALEVRTPFSF